MQEKNVKILVADDEKIIRDGLSVVVDWKAHGYEIVCQASNGEEALAWCRKEPPDIVLTDIRMPVMDGLALIAELRRSFPEIRIVILTCHEDFTYAREALKMGVDDYILKHSINYDELLRVLDGLMNKKRGVIPETEADGQDVMGLEHLMHLLLRDRKPENEDIAQAEPVLGGRQGHNWIAVYRVPEKMPAEQPVPQLCMHEVELPERPGFRTFFASGSDNLRMMLFRADVMNRQEGEATVRDTLRSCQTALKQHGLMPPPIAVSAAFQGATGAWNAFREAMEALNHGFYQPLEIIRDGRFIHPFAKPQDLSFGAEDFYRNALISGQTEEICRAVSGVFIGAQNQHMVPELFKQTCVQFLTRMVERVNDLGCRLQDLYTVPTTPYLELLHAASADRAEHVLLEFFQRAAAFLSQKRFKNLKRELVRALELIEKNYATDITLKDIAEEVSLSYNYLVTLFRQEIGRSFAEYLTDLRMRKARELLSGSGMKIYEVSEAVGYRDSAYFCNLFKKVTGYTPLDYRQTAGNGMIHNKS